MPAYIVSLSRHRSKHADGRLRQVGTPARHHTPHLVIGKERVSAVRLDLVTQRFGGGDAAMELGLVLAVEDE
eukprot:1505111-Pleurochrysis_carterae.AAC.1